MSVNSEEQLGVVLAQPFYELIETQVAPCRIADRFRQRQIDLIGQAFKIRALESRDRTIPIPLVIFPEYSLPYPSPDALSVIQTEAANVDGEAIFVGGLEGMNDEHLSELLVKYPPSSEVSKPELGPGTFANVCVICIRKSDGSIEWHYQAKMFPAEFEQQKSLRLGRRVLYFNLGKFYFYCQICIDLMAKRGEVHLHTEIQRKLSELNDRNPTRVDFVIVPQYHEKPEHPDQIEAIKCALFSSYERMLNLNGLVLLTVNRASNLQVGEFFGHTGAFYASPRWRDPCKITGPNSYALKRRNGIESALFRLKTDSIHLTTLVPPLHNMGNPGNERFPFHSPRSYLYSIEPEQLPFYFTPVEAEAGSYVECDCFKERLGAVAVPDLPSIDSKGRWDCTRDEQDTSLKEKYLDVRTQFLSLSPNQHERTLGLLLMKHSDRCGNPDLWDLDKCDAIIELLSTLCVMSEYKTIELDSSDLWTAKVGGNLSIVVIDGIGTYNYSSIGTEYTRNYADRYVDHQHRKNPVLIVAVRSRGQATPMIQPINTDIAKPGESTGEDITKPTDLKFYVCQGSMIDGARADTTISQFFDTQMEAINNEH